jgi:hypothetical protein
MKEKIKVLVESVKKVLKNAVIYVIIVCAAVASFFVGIYYNKSTTKKEKPTYQVTKVLKTDVNLAIDESNNLIVIDNKTGNYTVYQDSIGTTIFKLYAKNVWGQHTSLTKVTQ